MVSHQQPRGLPRRRLYAPSGYVTIVRFGAGNTVFLFFKTVFCAPQPKRELDESRHHSLGRL